MLARASGSQGGDLQLAPLMSLAEALDVRDTGNAVHSRTVGRYARITAVELGLNAERVERVRVAGVLHDVGKIGVSDPVLVKTGPLGEEDWRELRTHPEIGAQLLSRPELADLRAWVLAHHERPDGTGYPAGLSGDDIPLEARILAVADAYEAMTRGRVYREALGREAAREELRAGSGSQFDGKVVDAFLRGPRAGAGRGARTRPRQLSQSSHKVLRSCTVSCPGGGAEATARFASQTARRRHPLGNPRTQDNRRTALAARGAVAGRRSSSRSRCRCSWPPGGRCSPGRGSPPSGSLQRGVQTLVRAPGPQHAPTRALPSAS